VDGCSVLLARPWSLSVAKVFENCVMGTSVHAATMFRLPSAWNIPHSSDECEFSSCDDGPEGILQPSEFAMDVNMRGQKNSAKPAFSVTPSTNVQRKRTSSKLEATLDDSDIETSPTRPILHQTRVSQGSISRSLSNKNGPLAARLSSPATSIKPAVASASSIEDIEVDTPTQDEYFPLLNPKHNLRSHSGNGSGWIKSISDSAFQQHCGNLRSSRTRANLRTAESVLVRQAYVAVQRNRDSLNSNNQLLHSQIFTATHSCELMLLNVVSCEPCHLPVFPVQVHFCNRKFGYSLHSECKTTARIKLFSPNLS
jgi:hypothetical protein